VISPSCRSSRLLVCAPSLVRSSRMQLWQRLHFLRQLFPGRLAIPRTQLCTRSCSNKHTHGDYVDKGMSRSFSLTAWINAVSSSCESRLPLVVFCFDVLHCRLTLLLLCHFYGSILRVVIRVSRPPRIVTTRNFGCVRKVHISGSALFRANNH
jgi:hypothetical protein